MKAVSEYSLAIFVSFIIALIVIIFFIGWIKNTGEKSQRERDTVLAAAGCLDSNVCAKQTFNKACIHTIDEKNQCGCRAWLGIDNNPDCGTTGKKCNSPDGTNYGSCD